jgi:hypothetical protein
MKPGCAGNFKSSISSSQLPVFHIRALELLISNLSVGLAHCENIFLNHDDDLVLKY